MVSGCLAVALAATGCLRSTGLRSKTAPEVSPANLEGAGSPAPSQGSDAPAQARTQPAPSAAAAPVPAAAANLAPSLMSSASTDQGSPLVELPLPSNATTAPVKPAPSATPMLDEALERVEAIDRERRQTLAAESQPKPVKPRETPAPTAPVAALPPVAEPSPVAESLPLSAPAPLPDLSEIKPSLPADPVSEIKPHDEKPAPDLEKPVEKPKSEKRDPDPEPPVARPVIEPPSEPAGPPAKTAAQPPAESRPALRIADLKLCRRVDGYGAISPIEGSLKTGSLVLVYCEMAGLGYEAQGGSFVSRVRSRLSIRASQDQHVVWERDMGVAEDVCRKERRDYYVTYRVWIPSSITPGSYVLQLAQTDLLTNQTASADLPLAVAD